jgi:hypothetical protein
MRGRTVLKFLVFLFGVSLVFGLSAAFASTPVAAAGASDYKYSVQDDGSIMITGYTGPGGSVVIPDYIDSKPVKTIGAGAFSGKTSISAITLGKNVEVIRSYAFSNCSNLVSISLSQSVSFIWDYAFANCGKLTSILIPAGVKEIGTGNFSDCLSLKQINVEAGNTVYTSRDGILFTADMKTLAA